MVELTYRTKEAAEELLAWMKKNSYRHNVVSVNDILRKRDEPPMQSGFDRGYSRGTIKKLKPEKVEGGWVVKMPDPQKFIRDANGYWTTREDGG